MYTKKQPQNNPNVWAIIDPKGNYICTIENTIDADNLFTHLNRKQSNE